jgi:hypothetical protein
MPDLALLVILLQLAVHKRSVARPNIRDGDRIFWLTVMRMLEDWREALVFVQPDTVVRWHRKGYRHYWRRKSRASPGRQRISMVLVHLIRRLSTESVLWGAPRIVDELSLLRHTVSESTVAKHMVKQRPAE